MKLAPSRSRALPLALGLAFAAVTTVLPVSARDLPHVNALSSAPTLATPARVTAAAAPAVAGAPKAIQVHSRLGVPTFIWGEYVPAAGRVTAMAGISSRTDATSAARQYLQGLADLYGVSPAQIGAASVLHTQMLPNGGTLVKLRNRIDGIDVFREEASVMLGADRQLVAIGGFLMDRAPYAPYALSATDAAARALADWSFGAGVSRQLQYGEMRGDYQSLLLPGDATSADGSRLLSMRAKRVLFRLPGSLVPGFYIEAEVRDGAGVAADGAVVAHTRGAGGVDYYAYVIAGTDGRVLWRKNMTVDAGYRVYADSNGLPQPGPTGRNGYPHPTGFPDGYIAPYTTQNFITLDNLPFSTNDPWLPFGATTTNGNNVESFSNLYSPDGLAPLDPNECNVALPPTAGDFHACSGARTRFEHMFDPTKPPTLNKTQVMSTIVNLFYVNNYLHDWYYDAGFDEISGNAQNSNYGRGGQEGDSIFAEAQDFSGIFNANMTTPSDGGRPRMRMYLFFQDSLRQINSPPAIAGVDYTGYTQYGPQEFDLTSDVAYASPANGCAPITGVAGKIAFIDRGVCTFVAKVQAAQAAGAIGVIIANNIGGTQLIYSLGVVPTITIPTVTVSQFDGNAIRAQLLLPATVNARIAGRLWRDGTMDNAVVAHEWGHYISNRLIGDGNGIGTNMSGGMGEGWGDFTSLLLFLKESDKLLPANANFNGTYTVGMYALDAPYLTPLPPSGENQSSYYGIRRYPYSRDMSKNPLTYKHIQDGIPLPLSPPPAFGQSGASNSEVHNAGEVWATMLWECYTNLANDTPRLSFVQAQDRMRKYLVAGYKMTPVDPTFLEARDAILAAAAANDPNDFARCYEGFAKRGAGFGAVSPDRYSPDNDPVVESFAVGGGLAIQSMTFIETLTRCTDSDGILDNGESGLLSIVLKNVGTTALSSTSGNVITTNPHLQLPAGSLFGAPSSVPGQTVTASLPIRVANASGIESTTVTVQLFDPGLAVSPVVKQASFPINANLTLNASATDDVESGAVWTIYGSQPIYPDTLWRRIEVTPTDHRWLGPNTSVPKLTWIESPDLNVAATGSFSFTFRHRFAFETDGVFNYDGGQIWLSANGGPWNNIGASAAPGYNGTILAYGGGNPLEGQTAYVATSSGYPALGTVTVSLGTAYQGQTVRVRFVVATDAAVGAPGWEIDDIAFANLTNTPFPVLAPNVPSANPFCAAP